MKKQTTDSNSMEENNNLKNRDTHPMDVADRKPIKIRKKKNSKQKDLKKMVMLG